MHSDVLALDLPALVKGMLQQQQQLEKEATTQGGEGSIPAAETSSQAGSTAAGNVNKLDSSSSTSSSKQVKPAATRYVHICMQCVISVCAHAFVFCQQTITPVLCMCFASSWQWCACMYARHSSCVQQAAFLLVHCHVHSCGLLNAAMDDGNADGDDDPMQACEGGSQPAIQHHT